MPIKDLTDRESLRPRLARLGRLRKGGEKTGNKPGADLDHFRPTFGDPEVQQAFVDAYGEQPRIINLILFYETLEENFSTWIEAWDASGMLFRSDGEYWRVWREGGGYKRGQKPHVDHEDQSIVGRLEFLVPELIQQKFIGTVTLETHSNHDLRNIASVLLAAEQERGSLRGAEFVMRRVQEEISIPGWGERKGKRSKAKKWLVKLEPPRRMFEAMLEVPMAERPALESGVDETTGEIVEEKSRFTREEIEERWAELWMDALVLHLEPDNLPSIDPQMTDAELTESGKTLAAIVGAARASAKEANDG